MIRIPRPSRRPARGQSLTEFIIVVALVAIGAIGFVGFFGNNLRSLFGGSSASLAGNSKVANTGSATAPSAHKTLQTFGMQSDVTKTFGEHTPGGSPDRSDSMSGSSKSVPVVQ